MRSPYEQSVVQHSSPSSAPPKAALSSMNLSSECGAPMRASTVHPLPVPLQKLHCPQ